MAQEKKLLIVNMTATGSYTDLLNTVYTLLTGIVINKSIFGDSKPFAFKDGREKELIDSYLFQLLTNCIDTAFVFTHNHAFDIDVGHYCRSHLIDHGYHELIIYNNMEALIPDLEMYLTKVVAFLTEYFINEHHLESNEDVFLERFSKIDLHISAYRKMKLVGE